MSPLSDSLWDTETFYPNSRDFFHALCENIKHAKKSIDLSFYIFELDQIGTPLIDHLGAAKHRGVRVRILVDAIGSNEDLSSLEQTSRDIGIEFAIHNPLPWPFSRWNLQSFRRFFQRWGSIQRRSHKKLALIDDRMAFVGGINISEDELEWEDIAVRVTGPPVEQLVQAFERDWNAARTKTLPKKRRGRKRFYQSLSDSNLIWITTGYFVPPLKLLQLLRRKARQGADVRIVLSQKSDFRALTWISRLYFKNLVANGVQVYLYPARFIHAKCTLLDDRAWVGSSNLNHRSQNLDDELDITVRHSTTCQQVRERFLNWMENSTQVQKSTRVRFYQRWVARVLLLIKEWL